MGKTSKPSATFPERKKAAIYGKIDVWQSRLARTLVILLLCVHPLYLNYLPNERYMRLTWDKFIFFASCMGVVLFFVLIIWFVRLTRSPRLLLQDKLTIADWAVLGFALITVISATFSPFREDVPVWAGFQERYDGAITQLLYVAVFFIVSRWYRPKTNDFMLFGVSAILVALIGILQFYGMDFLGLWPNHIEQIRVDNYYNILFRSTLGNTNIVSTYVCCAIILCGFLFVRMKSKWQPLWLIASALNFWFMDFGGADSGRVGLLAAMLFAIPFIIENRLYLGRFMILASSWLAVYTLQRFFFDILIMESKTASGLIPYIGALAVLAVVGVLLVRVGKERDPEASSKWKFGLIVVAACIVIGLVGIEMLGKRDVPDGGDGGIIYEVREIFHGRVRDEFGTKRIYIWRIALEEFPKYPIIGAGPDTFLYAFPDEAQAMYGEHYDNAHNEYLQILVCQGILGFLFYLIFLAGVFLKCIPKVFKSPLVMAVSAAFVAYCAQAFFNLSLPIASQLLWVFAGMLASKRVREASTKDFT